jgi:hypothetical protein
VEVCSDLIEEMMREKVGAVLEQFNLELLTEAKDLLQNLLKPLIKGYYR